MIRCHHDSCGREDRIWLPKNAISSYGIGFTGNKVKSDDVSLHHWCVLCGCVKDISDDKPQRMGYWINILSRISKNCKVTQSQKRLVVKELESYEYFDDLYGITGSSQRDVFVKAVKKFCGLCERTINSFVF